MLENGGSLEKHLKNFPADTIDLDVIAGEQGRKCRLVAMRAAPEVTRGRRAARRKKARECGKNPCQKALIRDGWHIMLTHLSAEEADASQLAAIYRARWAVEIQFRAWKQALNLGKALNRKSNEHHLQALVLAGMIAHQLGMRMAQAIGNAVGLARLSYEKLYDLLAVRLIKARDLAEVDAFCDIMLKGGPAALLRGFIVTKNGAYWGVGTAATLLQAVNTRQREQNAEDLHHQN